MIAVPRALRNRSRKNRSDGRLFSMPLHRLFIAVIDDACLMGIAIGFFTALRILIAPTRRGLPDRLLGLLLLFCTANIIHGIIDFRPAMHGSLIIEPLQFLLPLALVWYLRSIQGKRLFEPMDSIHLALPLLFIAASYSPVLLEARLPSRVSVFSLVMWLALAASASLLLIPVAHGIARYRKTLKQEYSNLHGIDAAWLAGILALMGALFSVYALLAVLMVHASADFPQRRLLAALMALFTTVFAWKSLGRKTPPLRAPQNPAIETEAPDPELRAAGLRIQERVEGEKLFKDPELSLDDLARAVGFTRHQVSAVLNKGLETSFFDLINRCRVEEFKRLCVDPRWRDEKIMTLALEAGFNSKPAFNLVFKRTTGQTPSQYRKSAEIGSHPNG
jgi:AraC-like DNA-binding protein